MLEEREFVTGKIKIGNDEHEITLPFDRIHKQWIQKLLSLIEKIGDLQGRYTLCSMQLNKNFLMLPEYSFLGTSCTAISQFLYLLIKDELSEVTANFALPYLCENIATGEFKIDYEYSIEYTGRLLTDQFNDILAPCFLDTYFGVWSCFESAITSITQKDESLIKKELEDSKFKKYKKFITKTVLPDINDVVHINTIDAIIETKKEAIIKENPVYISFPDKLNFLFKQMKGQYDRDIKQDKNTLLFLGALRNTVHNNGKHIKKDMQLKLDGTLFVLRENEPVYFEHHIDLVILIRELIDIYNEILRYVTQSKVTEQNGL